MKININYLNIQPEQIEPDERDLEISEECPWIATSSLDGTNVVLYSDDFPRRVRLIIHGDFYDIDQKTRYAELLADRMNRMPKE
jgi:hypothetical protein